jgi:hypothetical protein
MANPSPVDSERRSARGPDLAAAAREAVVGFLHDASAATAERESSRPPEDAIPWSAASAPRPAVAESAAVRAAAISVATLERIESAAAKVEADIASALQAHADLQAGAGAAAEAAVRAMQEAWAAADTAVEADLGAKVSLRRIARYVAVTIVLVVIAIVILALAATSAH